MDNFIMMINQNVAFVVRFPMQLILVMIIELNSADFVVDILMYPRPSSYKFL